MATFAACYGLYYTRMLLVSYYAYRNRGTVCVSNILVLPLAMRPACVAINDAPDQAQTMLCSKKLSYLWISLIAYYTRNRLALSEITQEWAEKPAILLIARKEEAHCPKSSREGAVAVRKYWCRECA